MHRVTSEHSGSVEHIHSLRFDSSVLEAFRLLRWSVAIVVLGWITVNSIQALGGKYTAQREGGVVGL